MGNPHAIRKNKNLSFMISSYFLLFFLPRSKAYFSRCIPSVAEETAEKFYSGSGMSDFVGDVIADLKISWKEIIYMSLVALGELQYECDTQVDLEAGRLASPVTLLMGGWL